MWKRFSSSQDVTLPSFFLDNPQETSVFGRVFQNLTLEGDEVSSALVRQRPKLKNASAKVRILRLNMAGRPIRR